LTITWIVAAGVDIVVEVPRVGGASYDTIVQHIPATGGNYVRLQTLVVESGSGTAV
jgi:hypothetical protein